MYNYLELNEADLEFIVVVELDKRRQFFAEA